jgi:hypothetical protein
MASQTFEFALAVSNINNDTKQHDFIRPGAFLALVFLTDEDDCSAFPNDGLFGEHPGELDKETASLRCSTPSSTTRTPAGPWYLTAAWPFATYSRTEPTRKTQIPFPAAQTVQHRATSTRIAGS